MNLKFLALYIQTLLASKKRFGASVRDRYDAQVGFPQNFWTIATSFRDLRNNKSFLMLSIILLYQSHEPEYAAQGDQLPHHFHHL